MHPKLFIFDSFFLPTYGVLVALGFLVGFWVTIRLARQSPIEPERVANLIIYSAFAGILGSKLTLILLEFNYYRQHPAEIFSLSTLQSGGVYYGGLAAALITGAIYLRVHRLPILAAGDLVAPGIAIGFTIGRLGCFSAGCCWGLQTNLPWAVIFRDPEAHRLVGVPLNVPLHPTQLYEALGSLLIFILLWRLYRRPHPDGLIIGLYLVLYGALRFVVEFVRYHAQPNWFHSPLSNAQTLSVVAMVVGTILVHRAHRQAISQAAGTS